MSTQDKPVEADNSVERATVQLRYSKDGVLQQLFDVSTFREGAWVSRERVWKDIPNEQ